MQLFEGLKNGDGMDFKSRVFARLNEIAEELLAEKKKHVAAIYSMDEEEDDDLQEMDSWPPGASSAEHAIAINKAHDRETELYRKRQREKAKAKRDELKKEPRLPFGKLPRSTKKEDLEEAVKFKVGDKVKVTGSERGSKGYIGHVIDTRTKGSALVKHTHNARGEPYTKEGMYSHGELTHHNEEVEEDLDEAVRRNRNVQKMGRLKVVKLRIRAGKVQRRKKMSAVKGFTLRGGKVTRMTPTEKRRRKLGARRAKFKRKSKQSRIRVKTQRSMRRRHSMGL